MNKERLVGIIMVGLVIVIIIMYLSNRTSTQNLEDENAALQSQLDAADENAEEDTTDSTENESVTSTEIEDTDVSENTDENQSESQESNNNDNSSDALQSEIETYDTFVAEFIDTLMKYDNQEAKNDQLTQMTNESAETYLKENYYILGDGQDISDVEEGEHAEGDFEPLEIEMGVTSLDTYYTYTNNGVEVVAMYQADTEAGDDSFSGNYILKGTTSQEDGEIKFDNISSIVSINDPNADELYD